jgi:hypothetical protein
VWGWELRRNLNFSFLQRGSGVVPWITRIALESSIFNIPKVSLLGISVIVEGILVVVLKVSVAGLS